MLQFDATAYQLATKERNNYTHLKDHNLILFKNFSYFQICCDVRCITILRHRKMFYFNCYSLKNKVYQKQLFYFYSSTLAHFLFRRFP